MGGHWRGEAPGAKCVGGSCLFVPGVKLKGNKIENKLGRGHRYQPKTRRGSESNGEIEKNERTAGSAEGARFDRF